MSTRAASISSAFIWRRVHSLAGFWLVIYLTQHLVINAQAGLWLGDDGIGFIRFVNLLESLPFLQVIETVLIAIPLVIHAVWGVHRALQARLNVQGSDGSKPSLPFERNRAFTLQRLSSWILLVGIIYHVAEMRFIDVPEKVKTDVGFHYVIEVSEDEGVFSLAKRLGAEVQTDVNQMVKITSKTPGVAMLFMVRDHFKNIWVSLFYTLFVIAAAYHAWNGFWTFLITWGIVLSYRAQKAMIPASVIGMGVSIVLGLSAIWLSYWVNLRN